MTDHSRPTEPDPDALVTLPYSALVKAILHGITDALAVERAAVLDSATGYVVLSSVDLDTASAYVEIQPTAAAAIADRDDFLAGVPDGASVVRLGVYAIIPVREATS